MLAFIGEKQPPLAGSSTHARARVRATEESSRARITACGEVSSSSLGIAYFLPVATRERPARGGGARENPSSSPQPCSNGTLPSPRYPTKATHQGAHVHEPIQHGHRDALAGTQAAYLGRTKSTKEILKASPERRFAAQVRAENAATRGSDLTFPPPARLNRPLKVGGRIKTDEGEAPPEKHVRHCPAAPATATKHGPGPNKDTRTEAKLTQSER